MLIKIIVLLISTLLSVIGIVKLNKLPDDKFSAKGNVNRIYIYPSIGGLFDFLAFYFIGAYLTSIENKPIEIGIGFNIAMIVDIIYAPICFYTSYKLKRRLKDNDKYDKYDIDIFWQLELLIYTVISKSFFMTMEATWLWR